ncbi:MAG: VapC toxin family domain ribonuclease [Akkermansiaceae bacterium]|nr:VapC toxin family domain ribonuclease [Akkermansiaceae bacterium]
MDPLILIDSNVYIGFLNAGLDPVREIGGRAALEDVACCGVVKAEVLRGIKGPRQRERLEEFFSVTQMIATPASLWDEAWHLAWKLDRQGKILPLQDIVIACCALRAGAAVMTRDKHFQAIPDLRVIEP